MPFEAYLRRGLLKRQKANFRQIERQLVRAHKDLETSRSILGKDPEWAATIAYQSMMRAGRAIIFSRGYLPIDGAQHRSVVELTVQILGKSFSLLTEKFEKMRRKRDLFFYESDPFGTRTDAENSLKAASELIKAVSEKIQRANPQMKLNFE